MRSGWIGFLALSGFVILLAVVNVGATQLSETPENSCSIQCPQNTAYPGLGGSVTCRVGSAPVCQCVNPEEMMAYCEKLEE